MHRQVSAISSRLSLRAPQRRSLEILDRVTEVVPLKKGADVAAALAAIQAEFPRVTDFEREFPSLCFALATGVGKTRLMGAFISYLHLAHGLNNFFVLAPNLTIYNKLIADFTPNTPKYVFKGIAEFSVETPDLITGETYEQTLLDQAGRCRVNIFNISKINSEVRGGRAPRIKRLSEYIGQSYFDYLANLDDLVLLMDESHRYRASAGVKAINELKPVLGLELTATPYVETTRGAVPFKNVAYEYSLGKAMADGFVKEPAVVTRKNFNSVGMSADQIEQLKLEDGVGLHESVKVDLETYARETGNSIVKPFVLVIARDTTHATALLTRIKSDGFFEGRYKDRVIQVDSSTSGTESDEIVQRLLKVESTDEPTEIVIHVNMLKEGWDVTNLYTIIPLRAANAKILIEQSIGRGLRLPYGKRTGVTAVDRLNIVAHDRFQEIVEEANKPGSLVHMQAVELDPDALHKKTVTVVSQSILATSLGIQPWQVTSSTVVAGQDEPLLFGRLDQQEIARVAERVIQRMEDRPGDVPSATYLTKQSVRAEIVREVAAEYRPTQPMLEGVVEAPDIDAIVAKTCEAIGRQTIDIPRIVVLPKGHLSGFHPFNLDLTGLRYTAVSQELWIQHLRTNQLEVVSLGPGNIQEQRLEDYVVAGLVDFDDVSYDSHADLLFDLAAQVTRHLRGYLSEDETRKVLQCYQKPIAQFVHAQMQAQYWEKADAYEVKVNKSFAARLKESAYTQLAGEPTHDFRQAPDDKSNMAKYLFGGFSRCLYKVQKFQSDSERRLAVILDRDALKWFKPAKGQFLIFYRRGSQQSEYLPDFVAETTDTIYMLEPKARNELDDPEVLAKKAAAEEWCRHASEHTATYGGKPWRYALIPHDVIFENMTIGGLVP